MTFILTHRHAPSECPTAFAAWRGFDSPLRHGSALASCATDPGGGDAAAHMLVWSVEAETAARALAMLPPWLAQRAEARPVGEVAIP